MNLSGLMVNPVSTQPRRQQGESLLGGFANYVKEVISQQGAEEVQRHAFQIGHTLRLTSETGEWTAPPDAILTGPVFAGQISTEAINQFIDDVVFANEQNPYLMQFIGSLANHSPDDMSREMRRSSARLIPEMVAFAMVLQSISAAFYLDIELVQKWVAHWEKEVEKIGLHKKLGAGFRLKFESIRAPIRKSRECVLAGVVPERFCNFYLPFNILQASAYDLARGNFGNARTGLELSRHRSGNKPDPSTGAGPVHLVNRGRVIESGIPLAQNWTDLYQSWNLAFGAQFNTFPFYLCKLMIPQVAGYQEFPQQYIWNRTGALMAYLYFVAFSTCDHAMDKPHNSLFHANNWPAFQSAGLHRKWGDINHACARDYSERIRLARSHKA